MAWDTLGKDAADANARDRDKWVGVYIGILALVLAVCSMGGGNAQKEATMKNIEASNTWSFFQAKNMRRHVIRVHGDELRLLLASQPGMPAEAKAAIEAKIRSYAEQDALLTTDPKSGEGLDELWKKAKSLEADRDIATRRDPYFDYAQVLLQIAIVLASIVLIAGGGWLLGLSMLLGVSGAALTFNGFFLLASVPFIG